MKVNIYLAGVGGQGLITFATVLSNAALKSGLKALMAETHGLSQRGGSVDVHVRIGDVYAPLIPRNGADFIVAFELLEAFRTLAYAHEGTVILVNKRLIRPPATKARIPSVDELISELRKASEHVYVVDAYGKAMELGNVVFENMILLGALYLISGLNNYVSTGAIEESIKEVIKREQDRNIKAFYMGMKLVDSRT
ncbi:indolepyruvate oxidoreductase subunit beta [Vulcanisaeta thermophila]|uniref:indolepyruvate oxidoreductase subunit beta n=1 Tax=Vulcanisaeta thermophila TaxID=867917 RepID=UPI0008537EB8|nr:indolepyruvate oxidoreductase subunit beta [Vulcanisaeta thermophila]